MASTTANGTVTTPPQSGKRREWSPRMWLGCNFPGWMRLLFRNRFAVHWSCWHIAVIDTIASVVHFALAMIERLILGRRVSRTVIREAPIFIIGHWRTGTTFLHELLILDERHGFPNYYQCLEPNHFLLSERFFTWMLSWAMPAHRPMDNMAAGWDRPQEDEFALCMMGQPSPYLTIAFPNHPLQYTEYLDLRGLSPRALDRWKKAFLYFLKQLTYRNPKRLVLKSPPHTCRIPVLLEMFPDARFIHIVRDPYVVFPSTVNLWKSLYRTHGLQKPRFEGLEEYVFNTCRHLYKRLEEDRHRVPPGHLYELRYEDLVRDPVGQVQRIYEHLGLGDFEAVKPRLEEYLAGLAGYETNRYQLTPELRAEIGRRWGDIIRRYGYEVQSE